MGKTFLDTGFITDSKVEGKDEYQLDYQGSALGKPWFYLQMDLAIFIRPSKFTEAYYERGTAYIMQQILLIRK